MSAAPRASARLGPYIYDGASGLALLFGLCEHLGYEGRWRRAGLGTVAPVRRKLSRLVEAPETTEHLRLPLGSLVGLGSVLYSFALLARWLDEPDLLAEAHAITALVTPERIARDDRLDVMSGSAGMILALLVLERDLHGNTHETPQSTPLRDLAVACGEHLLATRVSHDGHPPAWPGPEGRPPLTGFAHGAAGISYSLLRLFARTGRAEFRDAALEGLAFERSLYDDSAGTWLDPRSGTELEQSAWCYGAPGVALGRLGGLDVAGDDDVRAELDSALEATLSLPLGVRDHLCCGNLGRADILLQAAKVLPIPSGSFEQRATALADQVLERARRTGGFALEAIEAPGGTSARIPDPTFFRGSAGVGYALLRLSEPNRVPCILALESAQEVS